MSCGEEKETVYPFTIKTGNALRRRGKANV
jgi:hypothetical protein